MDLLNSANWFKMFRHIGIRQCNTNLDQQARQHCDLQIRYFHHLETPECWLNTTAFSEIKQHIITLTCIFNNSYYIYIQSLFSFLICRKASDNSQYLSSIQKRLLSHALVTNPPCNHLFSKKRAKIHIILNVKWYLAVLQC